MCVECSSFHCGALNPPDGGEILVPLSQVSREADSPFENSFAPETYFWFGFTRMAAGWGGVLVLLGPPRQAVSSHQPTFPLQTLRALLSDSQHPSKSLPHTIFVSLALLLPFKLGCEKACLCLSLIQRK